MTILALVGWLEWMLAAGFAAAVLALSAGCGRGLLVWFAGRRPDRR